MKPELMIASEAAHRMKDHDDPGIKDLDRTMELGSLITVWSIYARLTLGC
jgi:hypothetical protein